MTSTSTHPNERFASNIPKFYLYSILKGLNFGLLSATWVIYLQRQHGLNMTQVTLLDVAFWLAATLGEVPTGLVADKYGRKASLAIGAAIMCMSTLLWALAPTIPLLTAANAFLAIGITFLSGAEDALLFETTKISGKVVEYTRLAGRVGAFTVAAVAAGNLASGFLATVDLRMPPIVGAACLLAMVGVVLTFKEPKSDEVVREHNRISYWVILRQAIAIMRDHPALRYALLYLTLVPIAAMMLETLFLQPQAIALGVPLAGVGAVVMAMQFPKIVGSTWSHRLKTSFGDARPIYVAPFLIAINLLLLGLFQVLPTLLFAAIISFVTAYMRPIVMYRIQTSVTDNIRATVLSMQSLLYAAVIAVVEPAMGYITDQAGLPASYYALAVGLLFFTLLLFWKSRLHFPKPAKPQALLVQR
jgi:MFS family permease